MSDFMKLFEDETAGTIEALVGVAPSLELKEEQELSIISNIIPPIVLVKLKVSGDVDADVIIDRTSWILPSVLSLFDLDSEFFLFGGDMPLVKKEAIEIMKSNMERNFGLVPRWSKTGYLEPLHSYYVDNVRECLERELRKKGSLTSGLRNCRWIKYIPAENFPKETFFNVNTPDDLEKLKTII